VKQTHRVQCEVEDTDVETENDRLVEGLCVTCTRCDESVEVFGRSIASARRAAIMLKERCPRQETELNYYNVEMDDE
jgi:hypothetical protein